MSKNMAFSAEATITSKGQVTIPKDIRERLELEPGERVEFVLEEGELTVRRKRGSMERLQSVRETLAPLEVDIDELRATAKADWSAVGGDDR